MYSRSYKRARKIKKTRRSFRRKMRSKTGRAGAYSSIQPVDRFKDTYSGYGIPSKMYTTLKWTRNF